MSPATSRTSTHCCRRVSASQSRKASNSPYRRLPYRVRPRCQSEVCSSLRLPADCIILKTLETLVHWHAGNLPVPQHKEYNDEIEPWSSPGRLSGAADRLFQGAVRQRGEGSIAGRGG